MTVAVDSFTYNFVDIILTGHRRRGGRSITWYVECEFCGSKHQFKKTGSKVWHTSCGASRIEWTITPAEYYILKPCDFSKILGDL